jgi:hypothetical protein
MGNVVIVLALVLFAALWCRYAAGLCWNLIRSFQIEKRFSMQGTWYWGLALITTGLLFSFAVMAMLMPLLLSALFNDAHQVSQNLIAIGILACLCLSWLFSLNSLRATIEDQFLEQ